MDKNITDKDLEKMQDEYMEKFGNYPVAEFENLSAVQMNNLVEDFLGEKSPIKLYKDIDSQVLDQIPLLQMVIRYMEIVEREKGAIKLTTAGYIPPKLVKEIYEGGFILDPYIESGEVKLNKELDCMIVELVKVLCILAEVVVEDGNKLVLTELGKELMKNKVELLNVIFTVYNKELNWSYFDGCGENIGLQSNYAFMVYLVKKLGRKKLNLDIYINKFNRGLPSVFEDFQVFSGNNLMTEKELDYKYAFYSRFIEKALGYFNLVNVYMKNENTIIIEKTDIFDKIVEFSKS